MAEAKVRKTPKWRVLLACVAVAGALSAGVFEAAAVRAHLRRELAEAVRAELGLEATLGGLSFRLPFRLVATSIRLNHPKHGLLVSARELLVVPSFWSLLRGELKLKRLLIEGARVRLRVEGDQIVNLPTLPKAAPEREQTLHIPLQELVIHHAELEVDARPRFQAQLSAVNIVARVADQTRMNLQLSAGKGQLVHARGVERIDRALLVGRYRPDRVEVDRLRFESSVVSLTLGAASFELPLARARYRTAVKLGVDLGRFARLPHELALPPVDGRIELNGALEGGGQRFHFRGELHGEKPWLDGFGFGLLDLKLNASEREIELLPGSRGRVIDDGGLVLLEGKLGLRGDMPIDVRAEVKHLVFQKLMAQLEVTQDCVVDWHLRGGFKLKGTVRPLAISGPIWADHLSFRALTGAYHDPRSREVIGTAPGHVSGRVAVRPDALRFENLHGKLPHTDMNVTVHLGFDGVLGVTAKSDNLDLRDATGLMRQPIAGHGAYTLDVGGTYPKPTLTGTLALRDFVFWNRPIGDITTRAVMEKGGAAVRFLASEVRKNASRYAVDDLLLDFSQEFLLEAKARFDKLALADFYDSVGARGDPDFEPYQGTVRGPATARYTLGFPGDGPDGTLLVDGDLEVLEARVYGVGFGGGHVDASWIWRDVEAGTRGGRLELRELHLTKGRGALWARGLVNQGGALRLTLQGEALRARDLDILRERGVPLEGELNLVGTARGTLDVPELALELDLIGMQLGGRLLGDGNAELRITHREDPWVQRALTFDPAKPPPGEPCPRARAALARATWTQEVAPGHGRLPPQAILVCGPVLRDRVTSDLALGLDRDLSVRGRLELQQLPTVWLLPEGAAKLDVLAGRLSGVGVLSGGNLRHPDSLLGSVELSYLALGSPRAWLTNDGPVRVALTGHGLHIDSARFSGAGTQIAFGGSASLADGQAGKVEGALDLGVLARFVPGVTSASGVLGVDIKLTGAFHDPAIFGRADLRGASVLTTAYAQPFHELNAHLTFSERELLLEELSALFSGGQLQMHGSAALSGHRLERYELAIDAHDLTLEPASGVQFTVGLEATLAGGANARLPELRGTVHVARGRYTRPFSLGIAERLTGFSQAKRAEQAHYDPARDRLALDLRVIDEGPLRITNNLLNAELSIEDSERPFRLVGTDQRIGLLGTLAVERGSLRFRSTEFRVEQGTVRFSDEHRIHPQIDLYARTEFRRTADTSNARWSILLHASGDTDDLKLETSSEPALANEDIVLLLTAGLTRAEAERVSSGNLTQGAALEALATLTGVDREVKRALPVIDDFAVTSAYSVRTNRTEPQVVVGKRLSDRVRASAATGLTTDSNFRTNVEWRLNDQTSVQASYDNVQTTTASQFGNVGVDLRWRLEFD